MVKTSPANGRNGSINIAGKWREMSRLKVLSSEDASGDAASLTFGMF